ncbi:spore coat protein GerQ [Cohnella pontilimi]|uniref:Spore coat protein GerQ n=2 Tax=Cohnella pontilimi TaxID=2564100 RepID=A0A4V5LRN2_9BACL|nr:spore coat protein GerQ [Cohnella pontilimi]
MPGGFPGVGGYPTGVAGASAMMPGMLAPPPIPSGAGLTPDGMAFPTAPPAAEESYIENILRMNLGKVATIFMTFESNREWNAKVFRGELEAAGRDHIIISDPTTGRRYVLLMVNLDYIVFDQPLVYSLPFGTGPGPGTTGLTRSE